MSFPRPRRCFQSGWFFGLAVVFGLSSGVRAEVLALGGDNFIVKSDDGYGLGECIRSGDDCAKIVADAWCSAHGHGSAKSFGPARDNVTASIAKISALRAPRIGEDDVFIACAP